jgi:NAD+ synthase (glutamine-hydrolysing)
MGIWVPKQDFLRIELFRPKVRVCDVDYHVRQICEEIAEAREREVSIVCTPELSLTGYSCQDMFRNRKLLDEAMGGLLAIARNCPRDIVAIVGLPLEIGAARYNCAAVVTDDKVLGIVPKQKLPEYKEFYERRWFEEYRDEAIEIDLTDNGGTTWFGPRLLFQVGDAMFGVEICEDGWVSNHPSQGLAEAGATVIFNPSASPELIGKFRYRRNNVVAAHSGNLICAYAYCGCDRTEPSDSVVYGGHQIIAVNGEIVAENKPFADEDTLLCDIDITHLVHDRAEQHMPEVMKGAIIIDTEVEPEQEDIVGLISRFPFLPDDEHRTERLHEVLAIQANALAQRVRETGLKLTLGLSGGLDSTWAFLVACEAAGILGQKPGELLDVLVMPGKASSERTQGNAENLAKAFGVSSYIRPIATICEEIERSMGYDSEAQDVTAENIQARERTILLFTHANKTGRIVLGTGDLSEAALGWCTYNGDQQSNYHVNSGVPKTVIRELVKMVRDEICSGRRGGSHEDVAHLLDDILGTPISPELTKTAEGEITQKTEDVIGPFELHDFFLHYFVRYGDSPEKILWLAVNAFEGAYAPATIVKWLKLFLNRFRWTEFKRKTMPDGAKVGAVSLNPRSDFRMPSGIKPCEVWEISNEQLELIDIVVSDDK